MDTLIAAPANNERGPRYMEKALAAIHQAHLRQSPMTLVYGAADGQVALMLKCSAAEREAILGPIAAS